VSRTWQIVGWCVAAFAVITGLAMLAVTLLLVVSLNSWGSNK
jgi:hypothetical protein